MKVLSKIAKGNKSRDQIETFHRDYEKMTDKQKVCSENLSLISVLLSNLLQHETINHDMQVNFVFLNGTEFVGTWKEYVEMIETRYNWTIEHMKFKDNR